MVDKIQITCKNLDNKTFEFPIGTTLKQIYHSLGVNLPYTVMSAYVNNKVENLNFQVFRPKDVRFLDVSTKSGYRVYLRSLTMILSKAIRDLNPSDSLTVKHSVSQGYYCIINNSTAAISKEKIALIKQRMQEIVQSNEKIVCYEKPKEEAIEIFKAQGDFDKVNLIERLGKPYVRFFSIGNYYDYYFSVLAPSTGHIKMFDIIEYEGGMLLLAPNRNKPDELSKFVNQQKLFNIFKESSHWNILLGIENVGDFNRASNRDTVFNLIKVAEALHEKKIAQIADNIIKDSKKIALISGPSSSGKTTFSKRLSIQLMTWGIKPITLSMDNYFVERKDTPLDEDGAPDYESIYSVDIELFKSQVEKLLKGEKVEVPFYNFEDGKRYYKGNFLQLNGSSILIIEGIHALNPKIVEGIDIEKIYKIYVSALTTIALDNHNWISTTDNRLLRRIIRDLKFRNHSAVDTIKMWSSVRRGEDKWIFPYQEEADIMFNSSLIFEFDVLAKHALPALESVPQNCEEYAEAHRLLKFLQFFKTINDRSIPSTSLLREFLGGSSFKY